MNNKVFTLCFKHFLPADRDRHAPSIYIPTPVICSDITGSMIILLNIETIPNLAKKTMDFETTGLYLTH